MKIGSTFNFASGLERTACHCIAYSFDDEVGFQPDAGDSHVVQLTPGRVEVLYGKAGWLTGLWRSETGKVHVTDIGNHIYFNPDPAPRAAPFQNFPVKGAMTGVWGLNDDTVFAWGQSGGQPVMYRWNGGGWDPMDPPPGRVIAMHGIAPDMIYAVGTEGLIARWDGSAWQQVPCPVRTTLSAVFVASEDEMYACGEGKSLLSGSVHGWSEILTHDMALRGVVKWHGDVWLGAGGDLGLCKLDGNKLVSIKPNIQPLCIDARGSLLITGNGYVVETTDGANFMASFIKGFEDAKAGKPMMWTS